MNKNLFTIIEVALIGGLILVVLYWGGVFEPKPDPIPVTPQPIQTATFAEPSLTPSNTPRPTRTPRPTLPPTPMPTNPALIQPTGLIAFETTRDGNTEIYTINADGSGETNLTNNPAEDYSFAWSPDGSQIAFLSTRTGWLEIFLMNADGFNVRQLTYNQGTNTVYTPFIWSPDGRHLLAIKYKVWFGVNSTNTQTLDIIETDASGTRTIYEHKNGGIWRPTWSPDNQYITIALSSLDGCRVYIAKFSSQPIEFDQLANTCDSFVWSPNGAQLASFRGSAMYILNPDGKEAYAVLELPGQSSSGLFSWSPDGLHILYLSNYGGINAASIDGLRHIDLNLASYVGKDLQVPSWSPDGQWLTFTLNQLFDIGILNIYNSEDITLLTHSNNNYAPQWQPQP